MQPIPLQRKVFCGHLDVLVLQSLLYLSRFCCPFLLPYISVAGSFLQFGFICDGPAVFSESSGSTCGQKQTGHGVFIVWT